MSVEGTASWLVIDTARADVIYRCAVAKIHTPPPVSPAHLYAQVEVLLLARTSRRAAVSFPRHQRRQPRQRCVVPACPFCQQGLRVGRDVGGQRRQLHSRRRPGMCRIRNATAASCFAALSGRSPASRKQWRQPGKAQQLIWVVHHQQEARLLLTRLLLTCCRSAACRVAGVARRRRATLQHAALPLQPDPKLGEGGHDDDAVQPSFPRKCGSRTEAAFVPLRHHLLQGQT